MASAHGCQRPNAWVLRGFEGLTEDFNAVRPNDPWMSGRHLSPKLPLGAALFRS